MYPSLVPFSCTPAATGQAWPILPSFMFYLLLLPFILPFYRRLLSLLFGVFILSPSLPLPPSSLPRLGALYLSCVSCLARNRYAFSCFFRYPAVVLNVAASLCLYVVARSFCVRVDVCASRRSCPLQVGLYSLGQFPTSACAGALLRPFFFFDGLSDRSFLFRLCIFCSLFRSYPFLLGVVHAWTVLLSLFMLFPFSSSQPSGSFAPSPLSSFLPLSLLGGQAALSLSLFSLFSRRLPRRLLFLITIFGLLLLLFFASPHFLFSFRPRSLSSATPLFYFCFSLLLRTPGTETQLS